MSKKKKNKMFNSIKKIIATLLVVGMNWSGLTAVFGTYAMFSDSEASADNIFQAGTLDFAVQHSWSYDPDSTCDPQTEICPGWGLTDTVSLATAGTLDFQYTISIVNAAEAASSTMPLCDYLMVNGVPLETFASAPVQHSTSSVQALVFSLTDDDAALQDQTCNFGYLIQGWQTDGAGYGQGFFVEKIISSSIASDPWMVEAPVVENETGDEGGMEEETGGANESEDQENEENKENEGVENPQTASLENQMVLLGITPEPAEPVEPENPQTEEPPADGAKESDPVVFEPAEEESGQNETPADSGGSDTSGAGGDTEAANDSGTGE